MPPSSKKQTKVEMFDGVVNTIVEVRTGSARKFNARGFDEVPAVEVAFSDRPNDRTRALFSVEAARLLRDALPEPKDDIETQSEAMARTECEMRAAYDELAERYHVGDWIDFRPRGGCAVRGEVISTDTHDAGGYARVMVKYSQNTRSDGTTIDTRALQLSDEIIERVCTKADRKVAASKRAHDLFERVLNGDAFHINTGLQFNVVTYHVEPGEEFGTSMRVPYQLYEGLQHAGLIRRARGGRDDVFQTDLELTPKGISAVMHNVW